MFEDVRQAFRELLHGNVPPEGRREAMALMRDTLVRAKMALDDLRAGAEATRKRLEAERAELETVRRRKGLAANVGDRETVTIAERFEAHHAERVAVYEKKLEAQEIELALVEREVHEMTAQLKAAQAGVGSGMRPGAAPDVEGGPAAAVDEAGAGLEQELAGLDRARRRATAEAEAEARLAELKRRMGK